MKQYQLRINRKESEESESLNGFGDSDFSNPKLGKVYVFILWILYR